MPGTTSPSSPRKVIRSESGTTFACTSVAAPSVEPERRSSFDQIRMHVGDDDHVDLGRIEARGAQRRNEIAGAGPPLGRIAAVEQDQTGAGVHHDRREDDLHPGRGQEVGLCELLDGLLGLILAEDRMRTIELNRRRAASICFPSVSCQRPSSDHQA